MNWQKKLSKKRIRILHDIPYSDLVLYKGDILTIKEGSVPLSGLYQVEENNKYIYKEDCELI